MQKDGDNSKLPSQFKKAKATRGWQGMRPPPLGGLWWCVAWSAVRAWVDAGMPKVSFIDSPFTTRVEYEKYVRGEIDLPAGEMSAPVDVADGLATAMEGASVASTQVWGPLEYPPARKAALKAQFEVECKTAKPAGRLRLKMVHWLIFTEEERKEYGFDNFDEDLQATIPETCKDTMSWEDVEKFMEENL